MTCYDDTRVVYDITNSYKGTVSFTITAGLISKSVPLQLGLGNGTAKTATNFYESDTNKISTLYTYQQLGQKARTELELTAANQVRLGVSSYAKAEVEEKAEQIKTDLAKVDNYDEYLAFITGTGLTEDEYWKSIIKQATDESSKNIKE